MFNFFAEPTDMHIHRALVDIDIAAPHAVEQLLAREHAARVLHEVAQEAEFGWPQRQHLLQPPRQLRRIQLPGERLLEAVEPFLFNLFSDPDIFRLPLGFLTQKWFARAFSKRGSSQDSGSPTASSAPRT